MGTRGARKNPGLDGSREAVTRAHWGCRGRCQGDHHSPVQPCPHPAVQTPTPTLGLSAQVHLGGGPEWGAVPLPSPLAPTLHFDPGWELHPGPASSMGGSWVPGPRASLVTSPQDPAALTETSISHQPRAGVWLGSHSFSRGSGSGCSPAAKCPCPSPSPQAGVSVRVSCGASVSYRKRKQIKEDSLRLVLLRPRARGHGVGEPELVPHWASWVGPSERGIGSLVSLLRWWRELLSWEGFPGGGLEHSLVPAPRTHTQAPGVGGRGSWWWTSCAHSHHPHAQSPFPLVKQWGLGAANQARRGARGPWLPVETICAVRCGWLDAGSCPWSCL